MLNSQLEQHLETFSAGDLSYNVANAPICEKVRDNGLHLERKHLLWACLIGTLTVVTSCLPTSNSNRFLALLFKPEIVVGLTCSILSFFLGMLFTPSINILQDGNSPDMDALLNSSRQQLASRHQECRKNLSSLLASCGAPPLSFEESHCRFDKVPGSDVERHFHHLVQFTNSYTNLARCIGIALDALRLGTGLQLGMSVGRPGGFAFVERIELAQLIQWYRSRTPIAHDNRPEMYQPVIPISLSLLRRRIYTIVRLNLLRLKDVARTLNIDQNEVHGHVGDFDLWDEDDPTVVTLAMLRRMKERLLDCVSFILSHSFLSIEELPKLILIHHELERCAHEADCSAEYLTSLTCSTKAHGDLAVTEQTEYAFRCLFDQLELLRIAIHYQREETSSSGNDESMEFYQSNIWWKSVRDLVVRIRGLLENVDACFQVEISAADKTLVGNQNDSPTNGMTEEIIDHGDACDSVVSIPVEPDGQREDVTFVFSGESDARKRPHRSTAFSPNELHDAAALQTEVFNELRQRLATLPPANEVDIAPSSEEPTSEVPILSIGNNTPMDNICSSDTNAFIRELKNAILPKEATFNGDGLDSWSS